MKRRRTGAAILDLLSIISNSSRCVLVQLPTGIAWETNRNGPTLNKTALVSRVLLRVIHNVLFVRPIRGEDLGQLRVVQIMYL